VIERIAEKIGLREPGDGWALFEVTPQSEHFIRGQEYIGDVLAEWEASKRTSMNMTRYQVCACVCMCVPWTIDHEAPIFLSALLHHHHHLTFCRQ
jgi:hypothetical protein